MFTEKELTQKGKHLSFLLRHDVEAFNEGKIDEHGWRKISEISTHGYSKPLIDAIVETNNKKRYEYNEDKTKIRARQGHSIPVNVDLTETTPPNTLYHGTAKRFLDSIYHEGIVSKTRLYVHLSSDIETAFKVGERHGSPCVIEIDTKQMAEDNIIFYLSNNNVWLTEYVDQKYFKKVIYE